jgi:hypothetical protein
MTAVAWLRALPRWYAFGTLMLAIWPLVLLHRYPGIALCIALPAFVVFFIATHGSPPPPAPPPEEATHAAP